MAYYIDTSALATLVVAEAETEALREWIEADRPRLVSSDPARAELLRAVRRTAPDRAVLAREVLESITLIALATETFEAAAHLDLTELRTLDALHLAAALELGDDLHGLVTYDERMGETARAHGIAVLAPR